MILTETKKIKIQKTKAEKFFIYSKTGSIFNNITKEFSFKSKKVTGEKWRLVHDGVSVITLIEGIDNTITNTVQQVDEFDTEKKALTYIEDKQLIYEDKV